MFFISNKFKFFSIVLLVILLISIPFVSAADSENGTVTNGNAGEIPVNGNVTQFAGESSINYAGNTTSDDNLINLSECSSLVLHVSDSEGVISFRRDSTEAADLYIVEGNWGQIDFIKQYKTSGGYFFHAIVTSNGWLIGTGGITDGSRNRQIESIASEMVLNNEIADSYLRRIYNIISSDSLGHFVIKAPDGTYGVAFTNLYHVGKLNPGEFVLCPNVYSKSQRGYYDSSLNVVDAAIKIIYTDSYGVNRRNVMTYHYKVVSSNGLSKEVDVYGSNDNGRGVGRSTAGLADNVYYFGSYFSKSKLPQTPDKVKLGTYVFSKVPTDIFSLTQPVNTSLIGENIAVNYQVAYIAGASPVVKFNIPNSVDFVSATVSKGTYTYDASSSVLTWNLDNCAELNYITLNVKGNEYGTYVISSSLDDANFKVNLTIVEYGAVISSSDVVKYYKGPERLKVLLTDMHDNPLVGEIVKIKINGVTYNCTVKENGYASLALNLNSGDYNATVSYDGHLGNNTTDVNVKILHTVFGNDLVKYYRNATQYTARFVDTSGNPLANTAITFNINGVFYNRNTNNDGVAKLNINLNPNNYTITALNTATNELHSNNVEVLAILVEGRDLTKYYRNDSVYSIKVLDDLGNPLAGASVIFNINGVFYERQSNASGYANLNLRLQPGDYIVTAEYNQYKYSNMVHVLPVLFANDTVCYSNMSNFTVKLIDGQGNPYANQNITFNLHGMIYTNETNEEGLAILSVNLMSGEYIVTSSYNEYGISNKITMVNS